MTYLLVKYLSSQNSYNLNQLPDFYLCCNEAVAAYQDVEQDCYSLLFSKINSDGTNPESNDTIFKLLLERQTN